MEKGLLEKFQRPLFGLRFLSLLSRDQENRCRGPQLEHFSASLCPSISGMAISEITRSTGSFVQISSAFEGRGATRILTVLGRSIFSTSRRICGASSTISTVRDKASIQEFIVVETIITMPCLLVL